MVRLCERFCIDTINIRGKLGIFCGGRTGKKKRYTVIYGQNDLKREGFALLRLRKICTICATLALAMALLGGASPPTYAASGKKPQANKDRDNLLISSLMGTDAKKRALARKNIPKRIRYGNRQDERLAFYLALSYQREALELEGKKYKSKLEKAHKALTKLGTKGKSRYSQIAPLYALHIKAQLHPNDIIKIREVIGHLDTEMKREDDIRIEASLILGRIQFERRDFKAARKALDFGVKLLNSLLKRKDQGYGYSGDLALADFRAELARIHAALNPATEPKATYTKAEQHRKSKRFSKAMALYKWIVTEHGNHLLADASTFRVGQCLLAMNKEDEAMEHCKTAISARPLGRYRGQLHLLLGDILLERKFRVAAAARHFEAILRPAEFTPWWKRGGKKSLPSFSGQAMTYTATSPALDDSWKEVWPDAHIQLGILAFFFEKYDVAATHLGQSAKLRPNLSFKKPGGMVYLAEMAREKRYPLPSTYTKKGDKRSRFVLFYAAALREGWEDTKSFDLYSLVYRDHFRGATTNQRAFARFGMGEAYFSKGLKTREKAKAIYEEFLKPPLSKTKIAPRAILALAVTYSLDGDSEKAVMYLERLIKNYPKSEWAGNALYQRAFFSFSLESPDKAIRWYRRYIKKYPKHKFVSQARAFIAKLERKNKLLKSE